MEYLTRNTHNDRPIYAIESTKKENQSLIDKDFKELIDKIINVLTGLLSSVVSANIISILKNEQKVEFNLVVTLLIFLAILLVLWFIVGKWVLPLFYNLFCKSHIDITPDTEVVAVYCFYTEIMQKVAEITEIVEAIKNTNEVECKTLNYVISLYKLQEIVNFLYNNFYSDKKPIRNVNSDGSVELMRYSFNIYTVTAVLKTVICIREKMEKLAKEDAIIKNLEGIDLLKSDLAKIGDKLEKIKIPY